MSAVIPLMARPAPVVAGCGESDAAVDGSIEAPTDFRIPGVGG